MSQQHYLEVDIPAGSPLDGGVLPLHIISVDNLSALLGVDDLRLVVLEGAIRRLGASPELHIWDTGVVPLSSVSVLDRKWDNLRSRMSAVRSLCWYPDRLFLNVFVAISGGMRMYMCSACVSAEGTW